MIFGRPFSIDESSNRDNEVRNPVSKFALMIKLPVIDALPRAAANDAALFFYHVTERSSHEIGRRFGRSLHAVS